MLLGAASRERAGRQGAVASGLVMIAGAAGGLLLRIDMSGIGSEADMRRSLALIACAAFDPQQTLAGLKSRSAAGRRQASF